MNEFGPSDSICAEQTGLAERELSSLIAPVTDLSGPEQANLSAQAWLEESELMDSPPRSEVRKLGSRHDCGVSVIYGCRFYKTSGVKMHPYSQLVAPAVASQTVFAIDDR